MIPEVYFFPSLQALCTYLAYRVLLRMAWESYLAYGKRWEWTAKTAKDLAAELGASEDGVDEALKELRFKNLVEGKANGKRMLYRPLEGNFPCEPVPKKPPAAEGNLRTVVRDENPEVYETEDSDKNGFDESSPGQREPRAFQKRIFQIGCGRDLHRAKVGFFVEVFEHESDSELGGHGELTFSGGRLRYCSRIGRTASTTEEPKAANRTGGPQSNGAPKQSPLIDPAESHGAPKFDVFMAACARAELPSSRVDWEAARGVWKTLSLPERIAAVQGIENRIANGEFSDPAFRPRPDTYMNKRVWERPLRPQAPQQRPKDVERREKQERLLSWAAQQDRRRGNR
jgi:hypothetical protein